MMENTAKKHGKLLAFTPIVLFTLWTIYFFTLVQEEVVTSSVANHFAWVTAMVGSYTSLWITLGLVCTISAAILLYFVVHIARLKDMPAGDKVIWMVVLPAFGAFGFMAFWYFELKNEPEKVDVYPGIA